MFDCLHWRVTNVKHIFPRPNQPFQQTADDSSDEISVVDLEELEVEDFDILILLDGDDSSEVLEEWIRDKFMVLHWQVKSPEEMEKQVEELIERLDEAEVKAACGAGTSC
eukprot:s757_g13.t1